MARVASIPPMPGIAISIMAISGRSLFVALTASSPLAASATTSTSFSVSNKRRVPSRTRAWSSASRTRITWLTSRSLLLEFWTVSAVISVIPLFLILKYNQAFSRQEKRFSQRLLGLIQTIIVYQKTTDTVFLLIFHVLQE